MIAAALACRSRIPFACRWSSSACARRLNLVRLQSDQQVSAHEPPAFSSQSNKALEDVFCGDKLRPLKRDFRLFGSLFEQKIRLCGHCDPLPLQDDGLQISFLGQGERGQPGASAALSAWHCSRRSLLLAKESSQTATCSSSKMSARKSHAETHSSAKFKLEMSDCMPCSRSQLSLFSCRRRCPSNSK